MSMATLLGDAGRLEEGLTFIERAVESGEKSPDVYNNFGAYLLRLGKYEQLAVTFLENLMNLNIS